MEDWLTKKDGEAFTGCFLEHLDSSPHGLHTLVELASSQDAVPRVPRGQGWELESFFRHRLQKSHKITFITSYW